MKKVIIALLAASLLVSCAKKEAVDETVLETAVAAEIQETKASDESAALENESEKALLRDTDPLLENARYSGEVKTTSHEQYLNDPLVIGEFDLQGNSLEDRTYLVGSNLCKLYPADAFTPGEITKYGEQAYEMGKLEGRELADIPFGTILKASAEGKKYGRKTNWGYTEGFSFQDNVNYFYEVEYKGMKGVVFGADLVTGSKNGDYVSYDTHKNMIFSELLLKNNKLDEFRPVTGLKDLSKEVCSNLEENGVVLQYAPIKKKLYSEELIGYYKGILSDYFLPMFITTDLVSHSQHLVFDRMLQYTEQKYFSPRLLELCNSFIAAMEKDSDVPENVKALAIKYFQVPQLILRTNPVEKTREKGWSYENYWEEEFNREELLAEYPEDVIGDYNQIVNASGNRTVIFETTENFSQYKPRGHYTKNPVLENYFRANLWFGRIHFTIASSEENYLTGEECAKMEPVAMFIVNTVKKNPELYLQWSNVFDPITALIGESDDLGFNEVLPLWQAQGVEDFSSWASDKEKLSDFVKLCHEKLRPPAISSNSIIYGPSEETGEDSTPPMGWRFLGQRFTYDSYIHSKSALPEVRGLVRGLDVMKVLGSKTAETLLSQTDYKEPETDGNGVAPIGYNGGAKLKTVLDGLQKDVENFPEDYWTKTYYNNVLSMVKAQAGFETGAGFYFTQFPMWNIKSLVSAHSTWAELRHDTILYVKQYAAEKGGDGDYVTFRSQFPDYAVNYIEPNIDFWLTGYESVENLKRIFELYNLLDNRSSRALELLSTIYEKVIPIVYAECQDQEIDYTSNMWIRTVPSILDEAVVVMECTGNVNDFNADDPSQYYMAGIADVYTNNDANVCLEVGVGRALKIYVPLNDHNGKRIAVGFMPSYVEFYQDGNNRLTDEEWKAMIYPDKDYEDKMPSWEQTCIISAE